MDGCASKTDFALSSVYSRKKSIFKIEGCPKSHPGVPMVK
jgi:hypothetical protein